MGRSPVRAGIYTRISLDRQGRAGVERQRSDCEALCASRGWKIADLYEDNDRSAYSGRERPEYERLVEAVAAGKIDVVVAWHSDRLWRSVLEQQSFLVVGREAALQLVATPNQDFNPADADDTFMSTLLTAVAQKESADKARRMKRRQVQKAEAGEFHGGPRAFGHSADRTRVVEREAKITREIVKRVLAGEPLHQITLDLRARKVRTARGGQWRVDTLKDFVVQPRLAGLRQHHGKITPATWPAIITVEDHERVVALLASRSWGKRRSYTARKYLLGGGLLRCSKCGAGLKADMVESVPRYECPSPALGGCSGIVIKLEPTDEVVRDLVLDYLDSADFGRALKRMQKVASDADSVVAKTMKQLGRDRAQLSHLGDMLADGELERAEYVRLRGRVEERIEEAERSLRVVDASSPALGLKDRGKALRRAWDRMTLEERRTVVDAVAEHFVVEPAERPRNVFQPERICPVWRFR